MNIFRALIIALVLGVANPAVAAVKTSPMPPMDDAVQQLLSRLARNLAGTTQDTYSYALTSLNPLYPGTANVVNALNQHHRNAQDLQSLLSGSAVAESVVRRQVQTLSLSSKQVAFAINGLGANPYLNGLISRWNQTVTILNQIKAFVPVGRAAVR